MRPPLTRFNAQCDMTEQGIKVRLYRQSWSAYKRMVDRPIKRTKMPPVSGSTTALHHVDGNSWNNDLENLEIVEIGDHADA